MSGATGQRNPKSWLESVVSTIVGNFLGGLISGMNSAAGSFFNNFNFLTRTPPELSYQQQLVVSYEGVMRAVSYGLLAVVTLVTGFNLLWRPALGAVPGVTQILPRLVLGAILITTAHSWTALAIDASNAACDLFVAGLVPQFSDLLVSTNPVFETMDPLMLLALLIRGVLLVLLVLQLLMRLALADILLVLAPLATLLWILPQTQDWAVLWAQRFVSTVFAQFVQMLALGLGFNLATTLPTGGASGLLQPLLAIAALAVGLKIPSLMGGALAGGNVAGRVLGTASNAAMGTGVATGVRSLVGAAGGSAAPRPASARSATADAPASQSTVPVWAAADVGDGAQREMLLLSMASPAD